MKKRLGFSALTLLAVGALGVMVGSMLNGPRPEVAQAKTSVAVAPDDGKLRIIIFGAHPDDAEYTGAGVAVKWAKAGHHVKFVSTTNGDIGHWGQAGGPLAVRRIKEVEAVAKRMGVTVEVMDNHDGEIMPTMENRRAFTRLIRQWNADIVIGPRTNDYHPDHRYTGILLQDSAFMVAVPWFCPEVPALKKNPVFFYKSDRFQKPNPFVADVAVGIDEVIEPTLDALLEMVSQIHEGGANGDASLYPSDAAGKQKRHDEVRKSLARRYAGGATQYRATLAKFYGAEKAKEIKYAQAFEICEYGRRPSMEELKKLFPF
jgi:LmbE family N-acetylglucosaminyl deacetylase